MKRTALLIFGCLLFASAQAQDSANQSEDAPDTAAKRPPILQNFLQRNPDYHLRTVSDLGHALDYEDSACADGESDACNIGVMAADVSSGKMKAFEVADTNHDGKPDIVAVLVKNKLFNVVVLQAKENTGTSATPYWLVHDGNRPIFGVEIRGDHIVPVACIDCDHESDYVWTGSEYAKDVTLKGTLYIGHHQTVYSREDEHSPPVYKTGECEKATVLELGKRQGDFYWHKIKLHNGKIGFVLNRQFIYLGNDAICLFEE